MINTIWWMFNKSLDFIALAFCVSMPLLGVWAVVGLAEANYESNYKDTTIEITRSHQICKHYYAGTEIEYDSKQEPPEEWDGKTMSVSCFENGTITVS